MEQITNEEIDLKARAKSALIRGIVAAALIQVLATLLNIARTIIDYTSSYKSTPAIGVVALLLGSGLIIASMILGYGASQAAKSVWFDAAAAGVRRPPASVVARVLGLISFIGGIVVSVALLLIVGILFSVIS